MNQMKLSWFPCYVADWLGSPRIAAMSVLQEGVYHRLLCLAWQDKSCSLPANKAALLGMAKLSNDQLSDLEAVLTCFEPHPDNKKRLHNPRLTEEWHKALAFHEDRSRQGKKGAEKRWHREAIAQPLAKPSLSHSSSQSHSQEQKERKKSLKESESVAHSFGEEETDRIAQGFERIGGGDFLKTVQAWKKEIP